MKLKSVELVNALSAAFEQLNVLTQTSVNINQNVVKAEQGNFLLFARFIDTFYIDDGARNTDQMVFNFFKTLTDDAAAADAATKAFTKALGPERVYFLENQRMDFNKGAFEEIALTEAYVMAYAKALQEFLASAEDHAVLFTKKVAGETVGMNDEAIAKITSLGKADEIGFVEAHITDFGKVTEDGFAIAEVAYNAFGKVLFDAVSGAEDYVVLFTKKAADETVAAVDAIQKHLVRAFDDASSVSDSHSIATDKPLSEIIASVGDQSYLFTKKVKDETVGAADDDVLAFAKALADNGYIAEAIDTLTFGKNITDSTAIADAINSFGFTKIFADSVNFTDDVDGAASILDDQEMQFFKNRVDVASVAEAFYRQVNFARAFADSSAATEDSVFSFEKVVSETPNLSDSIYMVTGKQIYDIPVATESLAWSLSRLLSDSALLGDANTVAFTKTLQESASLTDSGSLRSQGYSDFTYFEGDFVGASETF